MPESDFPGILHPSIGGIGVSDISFVSGFDTDPDKVGLDLADAIHKGRNNYPRLVDVPALDVIVEQGLTNLPSEGDIESLAESLRETRAEVLLYSLPTGLQWAADAYADQHDLKAVAARARELGSTVVTTAVDVSDAMAVETAMATATSHARSLRALVEFRVDRYR